MNHLNFPRSLPIVAVFRRHHFNPVHTSPQTTCLHPIILEKNMVVIHDLYPNSHIHTLNPTDLHHREIRYIKDPLAIDELSQRIQWIPCWIPNPTIWLQDLHLQVIAPRFQHIVHHQILLMIWIPKKTVDRLHLPHHHQAIIVIFALIAPRVSLDRPVYGYIPILILEKNRLCARKMVVAVDSVCKVTCGVIYEFISLVDKSRKQTTTHHLSQWVKAIEPALSLFNSLSCTLSFHCPLYIPSCCNFFFVFPCVHFVLPSPFQ